MAKVLQSWFPCLYKSSDWFYVFCYEITFGSYHQYTSSQECANGFIQHDASTALYNSNVCFFFFSKWEKKYISLVRNKLTNLHSPLFKKVNKITLFKMWSSYKTYNYTDTYQYSTFNLPKKNYEWLQSQYGCCDIKRCTVIRAVPIALQTGSLLIKLQVLSEQGRKGTWGVWGWESQQRAHLITILILIEISCPLSPFALFPNNQCDGSLD